MKICCFHGTTSKLYYPKARPQGFLGSTFSGHLLLEVASWLPKKGHFLFFLENIFLGIFLGFSGFFWIVSGLFLVSRKDALGPFTHFQWSLSRRMPWGLAPISCGGLPKKCPGAWHPFPVEAFQKRGLGPGTL